MQQGYTHITVVLDRSGSMQSIREDTIGGFNAFLKAQQEVGQRATLTLVQFDSVDPYEVLCHFKPVQEVLPLTAQSYVPRGGTPLLDALGRCINDAEAQIARLPAENRPEKAIFAIITDGQENASHEFRKEQVQAMIRAKQELLLWQFVFLSADLDAFNDALAAGVQAAAAMTFDKDAAGAAQAWDSLSSRVKDVRTNRAKDVAFTEDDRNRHNSEQRRRRR